MELDGKRRGNGAVTGRPWWAAPSATGPTFAREPGRLPDAANRKPGSDAAFILRFRHRDKNAFYLSRRYLVNFF